MLTNEELLEATKDPRLDEDLREFAKLILGHGEFIKEVERIHHEENTKCG
jgi:hypothetical protein